MCTALSALCQTSLSPCVLHLGNALKCCKTTSHHTMNNRNYIRRLFLPVNKFPSAVEREKRMYGAAALASSTIPGVLSKQQAKDLAVRLTSDERDVLISALQECQSKKAKAEYEVETVPQPHRRDLMRVSIANAIPFIGFGFLDNFIMIIAGEHIEASLGAVISLTTMAAAALGNTISDILGIGSAFYVEKLAQKIGFQPPKLTPIQLDLPRSRRAANLGRVIGVTIGCTLGMLPLLLLHQDAKDKDEEAK